MEKTLGSLRDEVRPFMTELSQLRVGWLVDGLDQIRTVETETEGCQGYCPIEAVARSRGILLRDEPAEDKDTAMDMGRLLGLSDEAAAAIIHAADWSEASLRDDLAVATGLLD